MKKSNDRQWIVWGKIHGSDVSVKLISFYDLRKAKKWKQDNKKYYDDMHIYAFEKQ